MVDYKYKSVHISTLSWLRSSGERERERERDHKKTCAYKNINEKTIHDAFITNIKVKFI